MEWINLTITQLAAPEFRRSTMDDRGAWLTLLGYCVQQENAGRIAGAAAWSDFELTCVLGIPPKALKGEHLLWAFEEGDLVVSGYPMELQKSIEAKRNAARSANRKRWGTGSSSDSVNGSVSESLSDSQSDSQSDTESESIKVKIRVKDKGKSKKGASLLPADAGDPLGQRMLLLNDIFNRRESTRWSADEITALKNAGLHEMPDDQFQDEADLVTAFYRATIPADVEKKFWRRTELIRVLRHWSGEHDRAQAWSDWLREKLSREQEGRL